MTSKQIIKLIKDKREWHLKAYNETLNDGYKHGSKDSHLLVVQVCDSILEEIENERKNIRKS